MNSSLPLTPIASSRGLHTPGHATHTARRSPGQTAVGPPPASGSSSRSPCRAHPGRIWARRPRRPTRRESSGTVVRDDPRPRRRTHAARSSCRTRSLQVSRRAWPPRRTSRAAGYSCLRTTAERGLSTFREHQCSGRRNTSSSSRGPRRTPTRCSGSSRCCRSPTSLPTYTAPAPSEQPEPMRRTGAQRARKCHNPRFRRRAAHRHRRSRSG